MLSLKNISISVEEDKSILKNIDLEIGDGKFVVITGPNGGGKSTLAKVIAGILTPSEGRIYLDGQDITEKSITERAKLGISFAFQQPVRFKGITVRDLLTLASGEPLDEMQLCSYLFDVGLCAKDYIDREVNASLSGGEIKRIEIAMALARKTKLTLFDEPEAGIDLWSFNNLIDVFKKLRHEIQGSLVIISHQERILDIADEIIVLSDGSITAQGGKDDVLPKLLGDGERCQFCPKQEVLS
ncbi:ABC transporter ATP-binding protein [Candidatus Soleaferrea massiliensis]|uniref:ABC transporter ATP-binding protein n=1 Tax=Candidatus Soleaferrea massiliensis TaxID=1470354 RepID=UPI00058C2013|nr:ATP-binding cassette domain-containing protein [Candidatus Soleaferrea massiliensis]